MKNEYITGAMIKRLREEEKLTQSDLAEKIFVTDKAVSKWETGRGYPDISLVEALAKTVDCKVKCNNILQSVTLTPNIF